MHTYMTSLGLSRVFGGGFGSTNDWQSSGTSAEGCECTVYVLKDKLIMDQVHPYTGEREREGEITSAATYSLNRASQFLDSLLWRQETS